MLSVLFRARVGRWWPRKEIGSSLSDQITSGRSISAGGTSSSMKGNLHVVGRHVGFYDVMNLSERQPGKKKVIDVSFLEIGADPKLEINMIECKVTRWGQLTNRTFPGEKS